MQTYTALGCGLLLVVSAVQAAADGKPAFSRLSALPAPQIVETCEVFPGGNYKPANLLDGQVKTEFASHGQGVKTFVEFDFGAPVRVAGFRHVDRKDVAVIAASRLTFRDAAGKELGSHDVQHPGERSGVTFSALPTPITAQRVRWQVTKQASPHGCLGGAEITFFTSGEPESTPKGMGVEVRAVAIVEQGAGGPRQPLQVTLDYPYAQPVETVVRVSGQEPRTVRLHFGRQRLDYAIPAVAAMRPLEISVECGGVKVIERKAELPPVRQHTIYILPHSHTDIGYTEIQTEIEDKQVNNLLRGIEYAQKTAAYPPGARFVWNVEVLWAADLYLHRLGQPQQAAFREALAKGQIALCGMYLNELTGLCRPEELLRLFRYATQLRAQSGATVDSAMISDVPGYTWGTVPAMAQAGIKYFSVAPNYLDRIGDILVQWENKPFYWVGPAKGDKVLVWIPYKGYAMSHIQRTLTPAFVEEYLAHLDDSQYPYDIAYMRWAGHGDNAVPDPAICEFVKEWSATHVWPKFVIASTSEAFRALEARYGDRLPHVRGDWTPYWEDGAGSSALETGLNRASSNRVAQAEALWAIQNPRTYPAAEFETAWRDVLLYSEHTWGAWCSVSQPDRRETREQWTVKQSYAVAADRESRELLSRALGQGQQTADEAKLDVFNTASWPRSELVVVPKYLAENNQRVLDAQGKPLPSQRLASGELAFWAKDVPPLGAARYTLDDAPAHVEGKATAKDGVLQNEHLRVTLDPQTGGIAELQFRGLKENLADTSGGETLNDYRYLIGDKLADLKRNGPVKISVRERGPLVASLLVESDAPGCVKLTREVRLAAGADCVELVNLIDKQRLAAADYRAPEGKESVNFAFPFRVPDGQVRLDVPFGVLRPDAEQIPSACKNWFTVGSWADVSNAQFGVTWLTLDAPLVEVGEITATLLNSQSNPDTWRKQVGPTQKLYSWAMNNHWHTNYRAYQEGPLVFRFVLRPHGKLDLAAASRLAFAYSQPLVPAGVRGAIRPGVSRFTLDNPDVLVAGLKPSDDGRAAIVRLWEAAGRDGQVTLAWSSPAPRRVFRSDLGEKPLAPLDGPVAMPAWGLVTLRAEFE